MPLRAPHLPSRLRQRRFLSFASLPGRLGSAYSREMESLRS
jgi:hypothetical protein